METWGEALARFDGAQIGRALADLAEEFPSWPPTLGEFVGHCRSHYQAPIAAPFPHVLALPPPTRYDVAIFEKKNDGIDWARGIVIDERDGRKPTLYALESAREVLAKRDSSFLRSVESASA